MIVKSIEVNGTEDLPSISFRPDGNMSISGRSLPINAFNVYQPLVEFVNNLETQIVLLVVDLEYTNGATVKSLYNIINAIDNNSNINCCNVQWYFDFEDTSSVATGKILCSCSQKCKFVFQRKCLIN